LKIFLYGGTFDPVHLGHTKIIDKISLLCHKTIVVPTHKSPGKNNFPNANSNNRYEMLNLLYEKSKNIEISQYELMQNKTTYSVNTINYYKSKYKKANISFVLGLDLFQSLDKWYKIEEIKEKINFVVLNRSNCLKMNNNSEQIKFLEDFNVEVSSSKIRELLKQNEFKQVKKMLPLKVFNYIIDKGLYN
tara:strand:+ start:119 stop:688 length:570 start_codon:yes stop_codon:yes gene_type:complete